MAIKGNLIEDIFKINLEFYNYEKKFIDKDYKCLNNDEDLYNYIVNPEWLNDLKQYICYDKFKKEISKYNMEITDLTKNKNIKEQIKSMIAPNIKTNFPDNLKDENYINAKKDSFYIREGKKNKKDYYSKFNVLKSSEFNSLYNVINKKQTFLIKNIIFQNNNTEKIILQENYEQYELCHFDKNNNYYICDFIFYFYGDKKEEYLEKLLIYKTLNDFFINEKFEKKEEKDDYINIMKKGKKGKIIFINKNFNHIDIFKQPIVNPSSYSKLFDEFIKNKKMKKLYEFVKAFLILTKLYKDIENLNLLKLNLGFEKEKENQEINQKLIDKDQELEDQKELENQKDLEFQIEKAKLEEEIQNLRQNIQQQGNQKEKELIKKIQNIESQKEKIVEKYLAENKNLKDIIENLKQNNQNINQQNIQKENQYKEEIKKSNDEITKLNDEINKLKDEINKNRQPIPPGPSNPPKKSMLSNFTKTPEIGLANIGSTCYMNATLQCFSQTAPFTEYFLDPNHKDIIIKGKFVTDPNKPRLSEAYYEVVQNLWPLNNLSNAKYFEPRRFKLVLGTLNELFKKMEASDAKDMIVFFLEQIHKEINLIKPPEMNDQNQNPDQYNRDVMLNHFINEFTKSNKSIISDLFFTIAETTQKCQNCFRMNVPNYICYNYSIQNCFIFPLEEVRKFRDNNINQMNMNNQMMMQNMGMMMPNMGMNPMMPNMGMMMPNVGMMMPNIVMDPNYNTNKVTIYDCFNFNQKDELMCGDNQIFCNKCRQNSDSIYGNKIFTLSNILIMILNRGKDNMYKVIIDFPMEIDLSNYVLSNVNKTKQYIYSIYGVITHMGDSGEGGHFIAACKSPIDGNWYRYNDAIVSPITNFNKEVTNFNTPYILFYQRKK